MTVSTEQWIAATKVPYAPRASDYFTAVYEAMAALAPPAVLCAGCGSRWTDADLARAQAADPKIQSCCPERLPLTIEQWAAMARRSRDD